MRLKCFGKICYDKKGAVSAKNKRWNEDHVALRIYDCPYCHYWHLTSTDPYRNETKKKKNK